MMSQDRDTVPPPPDDGPRLRASALSEAYAFACSKMAHVRGRDQGYRLFWVRNRNVRWLDLPRRGAYAVIGRHTLCDVILEGDPALSLRHMLAVTIELSDGLALRLLDLQTSIPFYLEDETPRRSIVACGPVAVRLGDYIIGGVPLETGEGSYLHSPDLPHMHVSETATVPCRTPDIFYNSTPVIALPSISPIAKLSDCKIIEASGLRPKERTGAVVTLRKAGVGASVDLTERELDAGVLIGRAKRCFDQGLKSVLNESISRGHLLLLHHYNAFEAFDLCSTQGTYVEGRRVRRLVLPDAGPSLALAATNAVTLDFRKA